MAETDTQHTADAFRVLHLSTRDSGGAGLAAKRLHEALVVAGIDSQLLVTQLTEARDRVHLAVDWSSKAARLRRAVRKQRIELNNKSALARVPNWVDTFSDDRNALGASLAEKLSGADILTLHWVAGMVDFGALFPALPSGTKLTWRLPDMWALTGGCHYDGSCGKWRNACGACPQLASKNTNDLSAQSLKRKQAALETLQDDQLTLIPLCHWMDQQLAESPLMQRFPRQMIPNGVNEQEFKPMDRAAIRSALGIKPEQKVLLCVADNLRNRRKGVALLLEALQDWPLDNTLLLTIGQSSLPSAGLPTLELGSLNSSMLLSLAYNAADLFVIPSLEDNQPNTVLEALACSTPVLGFPVGGVPDMVRPGVTGALAARVDASALREQMLEMLSDPAGLAALRPGCRAVVEQEYRRTRQVQDYINLYRSLVA